MNNKQSITLDTRPQRKDTRLREVLSLQQVTHSDYQLTIALEKKSERSIEDHHTTHITFNHYEPIVVRDWLVANNWMNDRIWNQLTEIIKQNFTSQ